jgi:hypothetical protein
MAKDAPRQARRRQRKSQGLPASEDVGILAEMLGALRNAAEVHLGSKIYYALAACPNLVALYREDIEDAFEYLSLKSLDNPNNLFRLFREPAGAAASYGFGLCHDPSNVDRCNKEEYEMPITAVLTILYTKNALCVEVSVMKSAYAYYPYPTSPPSIDFNLGSQALHDNPDEEYYWQAVRDRIMAGVAEGLPGRRPTKVFLLGDSTHEDKFRDVMKDALKSILGYMPDIYDEDPVFSAARGAAEFAKHGGFFKSLVRSTN